MMLFEDIGEEFEEIQQIVEEFFFEEEKIEMKEEFNEPFIMVIQEEEKFEEEPIFEEFVMIKEEKEEEPPIIEMVKMTEEEKEEKEEVIQMIETFTEEKEENQTKKKVFQNYYKRDLKKNKKMTKKNPIAKLLRLPRLRKRIVASKKKYNRKRQKQLDLQTY